MYLFDMFCYALQMVANVKRCYNENKFKFNCIFKKKSEKNAIVEIYIKSMGVKNFPSVTLSSCVCFRINFQPLIISVQNIWFPFHNL